MFKIIRQDNFDREGPGRDDVLVCTGIRDEELGTAAAKALNECYGSSHPYFYRCVPHEYELNKFEP